LYFIVCLSLNRLKRSAPPLFQSGATLSPHSARATPVEASRNMAAVHRKLPPFGPPQSQAVFSIELIDSAADALARPADLYPPRVLVKGKRT
jgi:hypothetical protein